MRELAYAKVNIFLKIVGKRGDYHLINSRFMRVKNLYDVISFIPSSDLKNDFTLEGDFRCDLEQNTIYKAYKLLLKQNKDISNFFKTYKVVVEKNIPEFAGLGGGSSDCAAFLRLTNRVLKLSISTKELASIGAKIGADVPFFIYEYDSANVSGVGEIVEIFNEKLLDIETLTPPIKCNTKDVYERFTKNYLNKIDKSFSDTLTKQNSKEILKSFEAIDLNDLLPPSLDLYPKLSLYMKKGSFFSGSGSTFFKVNDGKEKEE